MITALIIGIGIGWIVGFEVGARLAGRHGDRMLAHADDSTQFWRAMYDMTQAKDMKERRRIYRLWKQAKAGEGQ